MFFHEPQHIRTACWRLILCNAVQLCSYFGLKNAQFIRFFFSFIFFEKSNANTEVLNSQTPKKFKKPKQRDIQTRHMFACDADTQQFCSRISPCVCKRAADKGLVTGATPAPPCKTCSQQNIKNRTTQVHGTMISPAAFSLRLHGSLSPVSRRQSEPPASLSRDFFSFFCLVTTITATPAGIISVISLSLEEVERGNNWTDSLESARQLCLAAHPQAPLLLVLQPNTQSWALTADLPARSHEK